MSATRTQPAIGHTTQSAPFGVVALIAGLLALGALGIAMGQSASVTPAAGVVPADVQAALYAHRMGEKTPLNISVTDPRLIVNKAELDDRFPMGTYPSSSLGPKTGAQKGLAPKIAPANQWTVLATNEQGQSQLQYAGTVNGPAPVQFDRTWIDRHR